MEKTMRRIQISLCLLALCLSTSSFAGDKIKVACIGDSITYGAGVKNRTEMSYPAQLQKSLGEKYEVMNCGQNGIKMKNYLRRWETKIAAFQPDIVTIKLGTNDTKGRKFDPAPGNKEEFNKQFIDSATKLVEFLNGLESKPKVYICLPVPVFRDNKGGINEKAMTEDVIPALKKLAAEKDLPVIDLYTACKGKGNDVPDGVHPNGKVQTILAAEIAKAIKQNK